MEKITDFASRTRMYVNDNRTRIVLYYGLECISMVLYQSMVLTKLGKYVLVVDNSQEQYLQECIPNLRNSMEPCRYKDILYQTHVEYEERYFRNYDVVICMQGLVRNELLENRSSMILIVTDYNRFHIKDVNALSKDFKQGYYMIYVNCVPGRIDASYVEFSLGQSREHIKKRYYLPLDIGDVQCALKMQYNSMFRFDELSESYQEMLIHVSQTLYPQFTKRKILLSCDVPLGRR